MSKIIRLKAYQKDNKPNKLDFYSEINSYIKAGEWKLGLSKEYLSRAIELYREGLKDPQLKRRHSFFEQRIKIYENRIKL